MSTCLASAPLWYPLYHTGLLRSDATAAAANTLAERFYGFRPVSPDRAAFVYNPRVDEVRNVRHGSPRRPQTHRVLAKDAPINLLLDQLRTIRADLRFREDGIHTTLTVDRQTREK